MIGLAIKAGAAATGTAGCITKIKNNRIMLVFIADDCSNNTREKILSAVKNKNIEISEMFSKEQLGSIIGKEEISVIGISDKNFAKGISDKITEEN